MLIMSGGVGGGGGGAVLMCAPSLAVSSPSSAPVSALLLSSTFSKTHSFHRCHSNLHSRTGLLLFPRRGRRGRRFKLVKASKEDEAEVNRDADPNKNGEDGSVDWDKAWSSFRKPQKRKSLSFLKLDMEQYVSRQPKHSKYPLSEEVDPLKKSERSLLGAWTSTKFTYAMVVVIMGLAVYMVIIIGPPPHH